MDNIGQIPRVQFFQLLVFYSIAHLGVFFILPAIYWDDWTLYNMDPNIILETFQQAGGMLGFLFVWIAAYPWLCKIITFIVFFITGLFVWNILAKQDWLNKQEVFFTVLFFLILPLDAARVAIIDFVYSLSVFCFFGAWVLMERHRIFALGLFCFSFNTQSLLVFYLLPILDWLYRTLRTTNFKTIMIWGVSKLDFLMLPFVWFSIKLIYFKPYGSFQGYNEQYHWRNLISTPIFMVYDALKLNVNLCVTLLFIALLLWSKKLSQPTRLTGHRRIFYISMLMLFAGLFPYLILGHIPGFSDWTSRHQLLMPLGAALFFVWLIGQFKSMSNRNISIVCLVAICMTFHVKNYFDLFVDWQKQCGLIEFISHSSALKPRSLILFNDKTANAFNRVYRFYEWNGILKYALHDETHFGINVSQLPEYELGKFDPFFIAAESASQHTRSSDTPCYTLTIEENSLSNILFHHQSFTRFRLSQ